MDNATLSALMKTFPGSADTPDNVNKLRAFYASDPKNAENRISGARMANDESGGSRDAIIEAMLDKVMAQTAAPQAIQSEPLAPLPMVQNASAPTRRSATAAPTRQASPDWSNANENPNLGPLPPRSASPGEQSAVPPTRGSGLGFLDLLGLIIGGGATAAAFRQPNTPTDNMNSRGKGANAGGQNSANNRAPAPYAEDTPTQRPTPTGPRERSTSVPIEVPPQKQPAQNSDAGESAAMREEMARRAEAQRRTRETLKNAKRTVTGRF